jgi:outer membrane protein TolC
MPLFGRDASRATLKLREAQADEALLIYQADVLTAFKEVEDALTRLHADRKRVAHLRIAQRNAQEALDVTLVRYKHGLIGYIDVLEARQTLLSTRDGLAQADAANAQDVVSLYKALGGGWDEQRVTGEDVRDRDNK